MRYEVLQVLALDVSVNHDHQPPTNISSDT